MSVVVVSIILLTELVSVSGRMRARCFWTPAVGGLATMSLTRGLSAPAASETWRHSLSQSRSLSGCVLVILGEEII